MKRTTTSIVLAFAVAATLASNSFAGTIVGARTSRTGTIVGARTGNIVGARTGNISGARTGNISGTGFGNGISGTGFAFDSLLNAGLVDVFRLLIEIPLY